MGGGERSARCRLDVYAAGSLRERCRGFWWGLLSRPIWTCARLVELVMVAVLERHNLMLVWISSAAHRGVVLRRLAAIEHRVIANDTDVANAVGVWKQHPLSILEVLDGIAVFPHQHEAQVAWRQDGLVQVPIDECVTGVNIQAQELRHRSARSPWPPPRSATANPVMSTDITNWLRGLGLEQYAAAFLTNDI